MKAVPPKVYLNGVAKFPGGKLKKLREIFDMPGPGVVVISAYSPAKRFQKLEEIGWQEVPTNDLPDLLEKCLRLIRNHQPVWYKSTSSSGGRARLYTRFDPIPREVLKEMKRFERKDLE